MQIADADDRIYAAVNKYRSEHGECLLDIV